MNMKENCREQLTLVKEATRNPEAAYVVRSRLKRLVLSCNRMIAQQYGLPEPVLPEDPFDVPKHASKETYDLAVCCARLINSTKALCQQSEALDVRWKTEWGSVQNQLIRLDDLLERVSLSTRD